MYFRKKLREALKQNYEYKSKKYFWGKQSMDFLHAKVLL